MDHSEELGKTFTELQPAYLQNGFPVADSVSTMVERAMATTLAKFSAGLEPMIQQAVKCNISEMMKGSPVKRAFVEAAAAAVQAKPSGGVAGGRQDAGDGVTVLEEEDEEDVAVVVAACTDGELPNQRSYSLSLTKYQQDELMRKKNMRTVMQDLIRYIHPEAREISNFYLKSVDGTWSRKARRVGKTQLPVSTYNLLLNYFGGPWGDKWLPMDTKPFQGMALQHFRCIMSQALSSKRQRRKGKLAKENVTPNCISPVKRARSNIAMRLEGVGRNAGTGILRISDDENSS